MNKICTSIEQSKKLIELGLDVNVSDCSWVLHPDGDYRMSLTQPITGDIPAWSLSTLLDILESEIVGEEGETYQLNIEKDGTWWNVWYKEKYDESKPIEIESTEDLVDACYSMIVKLNKINLL